MPKELDFLRRLALSVLLWGTGGGFVCMRAQQTAMFTQYWNTETQWCPAAAGRTPQLCISTDVQTHAADFENAGTTMFAGADIAFQLGKTRHGTGAYFFNDTFGLFSQMCFAAQYAYHFKMLGGTFSLGLDALLLSDELKGSKADLADGNDPAFPTTDLTGTGFDMGLGLYYQRKALGIGLAAQNVFATTVKLGETNMFERKRMYYFSSSYNIKLKSPLYTVRPSVMFRTDIADYRADITCRLQYEYERRRMYGGFNYSPQHSVALFFGGTLKGMDLCYSYEANTEGIGMIYGQHEISLVYRLDLDLGKKGRNLHKSVRWL